MPVLTMPAKPADQKSLVPASVSRSMSRVIGVACRPLSLPPWAIVIAVAVLACGGFLIGRQRPAHHYVSYFGYPMVLDTTTGKACYAVPPQPAAPARGMIRHSRWTEPPTSSTRRRPPATRFRSAASNSRKTAGDLARIRLAGQPHLLHCGEVCRPHEHFFDFEHAIHLFDQRNRSLPVREKCRVGV